MWSTGESVFGTAGSTGGVSTLLITQHLSMMRSRGIVKTFSLSSKRPLVSVVSIAAAGVNSHLGDRRMYGGRIPAREPLPLAVVANPLVVHPGSTDLHRPGSAGHRAGLSAAIANDQPSPVRAARIGVRLNVLARPSLPRPPTVSAARPRGPLDPRSASHHRPPRRCPSRAGSSAFTIGWCLPSPARQPECFPVNWKDMPHASDPQLSIISRRV